MTKGDKRTLDRLCNLEADLNDLSRWTKICLMLSQDEVQNPGDQDRGSLTLVALEKTDELAAKVRADYYKALEG